jgi:dihydrofolate synthase/folylpolyglutamate synthase
MEYLGDTLAAIAREKAGILRAGRPAYVWIEEPEAAAAVREAAAALGAELHLAHEEIRIEGIEPAGWNGQRVRLASPVRAYDLEIALLGAHQATNLGLAVRAAEALAGLGYERIGPREIQQGAAACRWPGRLESIELPGGRRIVLDAAHNPAGAEALAGFLAGLGRPVDLLFGVLGDKDFTAMLAALSPYAARIVLTTPASPRAKPPAELAALLGNREGVYVEADPGQALDRALALGGEILVACGSIFLIGEIRQAIRERLLRISISGSDLEHADQWGWEWDESKGLQPRRTDP